MCFIVVNKATSAVPEVLTDQLQYRLTLKGSLVTADGSEIDDACLSDYILSLQQSTMKQIDTTNELMGTSLCLGHQVHIDSGSATIGKSGSQVSRLSRKSN